MDKSFEAIYIDSNSIANIPTHSKAEDYTELTKLCMELKEKYSKLYIETPDNLKFSRE